MRNVIPVSTEEKFSNSMENVVPMTTNACVALSENALLDELEVCSEYQLRGDKVGTE
jgi:hypothetical protein